MGPISGATTPSQIGLEGDDKKGVVCIPKSSSITGTSRSDYLESYLGQSLGGGSYPSAEVQSVYSTTLADWAIKNCVGYLMPKQSS